MNQIKQKIHSFAIPAGYNKRYTIDLLVRQKSSSELIPIGTILQEILQRLQNASEDIALKRRMFYEYRMAKLNSKLPPLSEGRLEIIANYFGVTIEELITTTD